MRTLTVLLLCGAAAAVARAAVTLQADSPFEKVRVKYEAVLKCCFTSDNKADLFTWVRRVNDGDVPARVEGNMSHVTAGSKGSCGVLNFRPARLNDSGMYQCWLAGSRMFTHGTYLQVYTPLVKTFDLSESTKNGILTAEGVLLMLCVLLPSATLLLQSRRLTELERKKSRKEEENIYQGLNLDDCGTTYDQIERSSTRPGQYQDVCNVMEEEEDIQLEKP